MGKLRKIGKSIGRGLKKIGKKIGKAFKKVLKPFAKVFNKLGPIGTMALMMFLPGIGAAMAGWGASMGGTLGTIVQFTGNALNYIATAPGKIFGTITDMVGASWNAITRQTVAAGTEASTGSWWGNMTKAVTDGASELGTFDVSKIGTSNIATYQGTEAVTQVLPSGATSTITPAVAGDGKLSTLFSSVDVAAEAEAARLAEVAKSQPGYVEPIKPVKLRTKIKETKLPGFKDATIGDAASAASTASTATTAYQMFAGTSGEEQPSSFNANNYITDPQSDDFQTSQDFKFDYSTTSLQDQNQIVNNYKNMYSQSMGIDSSNVNPYQLNGYGFTFESYLDKLYGGAA